jgi:hypothetical protein
VEELTSLAELATAPPFEMGTRVLVHEDGCVYISVGNTRPEIRDRLGWTQGNVWMPDHVERRLSRVHPEIEQPVGVMALVLMNPLAVNLRTGREGVPEVRFLASSNGPRSAGYLQSQSIAHLDMLVELRPADHATHLRAFHLAPTKRFERRRLIWP